MSIHERLRSLLQREFITITVLRQRDLRNALEQAETEYARRGIPESSLKAFAMDKVLSDEYYGRATAYLDRVVQRMGELGEPWTDARRTDAIALLQTQLAVDWNSIVGIRNQRLGETERATGLITEAKGLADREIEEELEMRVLREERHRLPLAELLSAPRYDAVRVAWRAARAALERTPTDGGEAVRQAIGAVEALARLAASAPTKPLGDCLLALRQRTDDAGWQLLRSIGDIYNYSNVVASGRHGGGQGDPPQPPEARFVVGMAEQAIGLLLDYDSG